MFAEMPSNAMAEKPSAAEHGYGAPVACHYDQPTNRSASAAISLPQIACARGFG